MKKKSQIVKNAVPEIEQEPLGFDLVVKLFRVIFWGWYRLLDRTIRRLALYLRKTDIFILAFLLLSILSLIFCLAPWIEYNTNLVDYGVVKIGSRFKIFFMFLFFPQILSGIFSFKGRLIVYYLFFITALLLYVAGILYPNPVHTLIRVPQEYTVTFWHYLYGGAVLIQAVLAPRALAYSLYAPASIKSYLITVPKI